MAQTALITLNNLLLAEVSADPSGNVSAPAGCIAYLQGAGTAGMWQNNNGSTGWSKVFFADGTVPATGQISAAAGTAGAPGYSFTGSLSTGLYRPAANQMAISANGTEQLFFDGLTITTGTTNSGVYRNTNAGADVNPEMLIDPSHSLTTGNSYAYDTAGFDFVRGNGARRITRAILALTDTVDTAGSEQGGLAFFTQTAGTAATEKMRLAASGRLGINQTNPGTTLDVNGVISRQGSAPYLTSTATANTTTTLTAASNGTQIYTGTTAGQIVKTPDATTLTVGREFKIKNNSTVSIIIQDNGGTVLIRLSAGSNATLTCTDIGTAAGTWITDFNAFGLNFFNSATIVTSTNSSTTTYVTAVQVVTDDLPLGNYLIQFSLDIASNTNNRSVEVIVTDGTTTFCDNLYAQGPTVGAAGLAPAASIVLAGISGVKTLSVKYRDGPNGPATWTVTDARLNFWRIS